MPHVKSNSECWEAGEWGFFNCCEGHSSRMYHFTPRPKSKYWEPPVMRRRSASPKTRRSPSPRRERSTTLPPPSPPASPQPSPPSTPEWMKRMERKIFGHSNYKPLRTPSPPPSPKRQKKDKSKIVKVLSTVYNFAFEFP